MLASGAICAGLVVVALAASSALTTTVSAPPGREVGIAASAGFVKVVVAVTASAESICRMPASGVICAGLEVVALAASPVLATAVSASPGRKVGTAASAGFVKVAVALAASVESVCRMPASGAICAGLAVVVLAASPALATAVSAPPGRKVGTAASAGFVKVAVALAASAESVCRMPASGAICAGLVLVASAKAGVSAILSAVALAKAGTCRRDIAEEVAGSAL